MSAEVDEARAATARAEVEIARLTGELAARTKELDRERMRAERAEKERDEHASDAASLRALVECAVEGATVALARVAVLEAVLAEPDEKEGARLGWLLREHLFDGKRGLAVEAAARAILADLRKRAGVDRG